MSQPLVSYLKWVVRDPISGSILIDPLPHPHQSSYKTFIAQSGTTGSTTVGTFDIPLYGPGTDQYKWAKPMYDQLGLSYMQRVEAYMTTSPVDAPGIVGDPVFSGVITKLPQDLGSFAISGSDSLYLAQKAFTGRMEQFSGRTDQLFTYALKAYGLVFADDFTETLLNNYQTTSWTLTSDQGYNAIRAVDSGANFGLLQSLVAFSNSSYSDCVIDGDFHVFCTQAQMYVGVVGAIVGLGGDFITGRAVINQVTATQFSVDAQIVQYTSVPSITVKAQVQGVLTQNTNEFHLQLRLIGVQSGSNYTWRLLINGNDSNCTFTYAATPSGAVGVQGNNIVGAGTTVYCHGAPHAFTFLNKVSVFQPGQIITGSQSVSQVLSIQPPIDLMNLAMSTEQAQYRKNPKAGVNQDTMDFYTPVGMDLSQSVRFEEGFNLNDIKVEPNAEPIETALIAASPPGPDHQGIHWRFNLAAIRKHGLLFGIGQLGSAVHSWAVRRQADSILLNRATPQQAKTLTVLRDSNHAAASQNNNTTGLIYREGDKVTLHVPRLNIFNQTSQILGIEFKEGEATMGLTLDQYPKHLDRILAIERLKRTVEDLRLTSADVTMFQGGLIRDPRVVMALMPFKAQAHQNAAQAVIANATFAKIALQAEDYDTSLSFDNVTNYRFTSPVSGYYWMAGAVPWSTGAAAIPRTISTIYKNGVEVPNTRGQTNVLANQVATVSTLPTILYLNSGDYVELWTWQSSGGNLAPFNDAGDVAVLTVHLISL